MRLFTDHPESVGETYREHMGEAMSFGTAMLVGGLACCIHAFLPFFFETTGSRRVTRLHDRMVVNRRRKMAAPSPDDATPETTLSRSPERTPQS